MYRIAELYDLDHTLAKDYLSQFEYPWEALKGIKELILKIGQNLSEDEYEELKTGDFFYYGCINHDSFTREFLASEWYVDPSLQPLFVPWSKDDEELFVKKTAAMENQ